MEEGSRIKSAFIGSALGTFVGDALGMPVEGWPPEAIQKHFGLLSTLVEGRFPAGTYTDDTEMMVGILEVFAERGEMDPGAVAVNFLRNFHPWRGYGGRIYGIMERLRSGVSWERAATDSFGNGSAMRVAPAGFYYFDDPARGKEAALLSSRITHTHPEGLAGAVAQAAAVGLATRLGIRKEEICMESFLRTVCESVQDICPPFSSRMERITALPAGGGADSMTGIREAFLCDVRAIEAVPPAIASFLLTSSFRDAVVMAVNLGGDTDTIGAMAGAIAGAYYGDESLPESWLSALENGDKGRDYIADMARRAARKKRGG